MKKLITILLLLLVGFVLGYSINNNIFNNVYNSINIQSNYKEVSIRMDNPPEIYLINNCNAINFNVTSDQALSILYAMKKTDLQRPLTQDTLLDITNYYNISISHLVIDRKENDIYKGTIFLNQYGKVLELDARPSDIIAIALRLKQKLYVREDLLDKKVC